MSHLAWPATADLTHLERTPLSVLIVTLMAILMADMEAVLALGPSPLGTEQYCAWSTPRTGRGLMCIIDAGGIVGRHAGDGVVASFPR